MAEKCILEKAIGETRAAVITNGKPIEFHLRRWSDEGRPRAGDVFSGRIRSVDNGLMAAFLDLGLGDDKAVTGMLRFSLAPNAPKFVEGQMVRVEIIREAEKDKGPLVMFKELSDSAKPGPETVSSLEDMISKRFPNIKFENGEVGGVDYASEAEIALSGGGYIYIEHTRAATMIDIDTAGGQKTKVSIAAAKEIASQIRLRGIGGLILIDFPNFRKKKDRADVWQTLKDCIDNDINLVKIGHFSRFDTVELTRSRSGPTITQITNDRFGNPTPETTALSGLRRIEKEARVDGGAKLVLQLPEPALDWLNADTINWQQALSEKIGKRYRVVSGTGVDVYKDA
jgi:Ribonuclease G/E